MPDYPSAAELLGPGGAVERLLPGYETRPQQREMAEAVERSLREGKLAVIEAGTGTGKSFGYLFSVVLHALKTETSAVVSSSTHVLQDQLIHKDIPFAQRALAEYGVEFQATEVKGMGAYLCRLALAEASGALIVDFPDALQKLDEWVETAREGTRSEAPAVPAEAWEQVRADRDTCTRDKCRFYDSCFFFNARRRIARSQLLVANHSLVFADLAVKEEGGRVLPHYSVLVLDEAHNVEEAATNFLGSTFGPRGLKMLLHRVYDERGRGALPALEQVLYDSKMLPAGERRALPNFLRDQVYPELGKAETALDRGFWEIERAYHALPPMAESAPARPSGDQAVAGRPDDPGLPGKAWKPLRLTPEILENGAMAGAQAAAHHMAGILELVANRLGQFLRRVGPAENLLDNRDFVTVRSTCNSLRERAQDIKDFFDITSGVAETVKWLQPEPSKKGFQLKLATAPLDVAPHLEQRLFKKLEACILTSATLAVGRQFDYLRGRLGLAGEVAPRTEALLLDSPFDYRRNVLVGIPDDLPEPTDRERDFLHPAARFIWRALKVSRGRSLVLFHSWYTLRATHKLIAPHAEKLGCRVLCQGEPGLSKNQLIEIFRSDVHSVLLATTSYREGIDVPGEALSNLILHRLPFPAPDEPVIEARMKRIEENGGSSFNEYELPAAVIACKQAFGRLIRSHTDYGIFLCLDKRVVTRRYGGQFLRALPKCEIVQGSSEKVLARAAEFLRRQDEGGKAPVN